MLRGKKNKQKPVLFLSKTLHGWQFHTIRWILVYFSSSIEFPLTQLFILL